MVWTNTLDFYLQAMAVVTKLPSTSAGMQSPDLSAINELEDGDIDSATAKLRAVEAKFEEVDAFLAKVTKLSKRPEQPPKSYGAEKGRGKRHGSCSDQGIGSSWRRLATLSEGL